MLTKEEYVKILNRIGVTYEDKQELRKLINAYFKNNKST